MPRFFNVPLIFNIQRSNQKMREFGAILKVQLKKLVFHPRGGVGHMAILKKGDDTSPSYISSVHLNYINHTPQYRT